MWGWLLTMAVKVRLAPRVDDFYTAGHRFNEWGVCVEPVPPGGRVEAGVDICPVRWEDIQDVDDARRDGGGLVWTGVRGIAHSAGVNETEIRQIMDRAKKQRRQCCIASGWRE